MSCTASVCLCGRCGTTGYGDVRAALARMAEKLAKERERAAKRLADAALPKPT